MSQLEVIMAKAISLKNSHDYDNYCQRFVRVCYEAGGIYGDAASANDAYNKWCVSSSMDNVPRGASVYFKGIGSYGHVGIATGNGNVIHAANGVRVESLESCDRKYVFRGWGWQGGQKPEGATGSEKKTTASSSSSKSSSSKKQTSKSKTIEQLSTESLYSGRSASIFGSIDLIGDIGIGYELLIENDKVYLPVIVGSIELEYKRHGKPTSLKFNVLKDESIDFQEGSPIRLRVGGEDVFRGYVFEKSRKERNIIAVTAFDSLRYLKNKDTLLYRGKKYSELLKMIAEDYHLKVGDIVDTEYVIERQLEEGTLFDILENAADITYTATGKRFILLDDFGKICLRDMQTMTLDTEFNKYNTASFDYTTTIDKEVYDYVVIAEDDKSEGVRRLYTAYDDNVSRWGRLQMYLKPKEELTAARLREMARGELEKYSRKRRYLTLCDVKGDIAVRGGSVVKVNFDLGDIVINETMMCERVKHTFSGASHLMDIDLYGREGEFDV